MSNAGQPGKPKNPSSLTGEDIPAALRDTPDTTPQRSLRLLLFGVAGVVGFVLIAVVSGWVFSLTASRPTGQNQAVTPTATSATSSPSVGDAANNTGALLGHLPYAEGVEKDLVPVPGNSSLRMHKTAAEKYALMAQDARRAGVNLTVLSAFRSVKEQEKLFSAVAAQRNQTPAERAALSAPPGYSEHHTGYALDIGDANVPSTNLNENFEKTKAFQWLNDNAAKYGFEISFPRNNPQGVSYEPWHWRFVGDRTSLEVFYKGRNLKPTPQSTP